MDLNTAIAALTLIVLVLGIFSGVMVMGRKDQKLEDLGTKAAALESCIEELSSRLNQVTTTVAVHANQHAAIEKRVTTIEEQRGGCRLPHDHERG